MNDVGPDALRPRVVAYCTAMQIHIPFHWTARTWAGRYPLLFNTVFGAINDRARLVRPDTGLVIEGFPRSANSFTVFAFLNSGAGDMALAHHVHSPSQIMLAARYRRPAILLLRAPEDAVIAGLAKIVTHTAPDLLRAYRLYYDSLLPLREHYVIAPFETVTTDVGRIVSAVNRRFDTSFASIDPDRQTQLSKAFLAQEKIDGLNTPHAPTPRTIPPHILVGKSADRARAAYARMLDVAAKDGTR
jgi:hypothetical protein